MIEYKITEELLYHDDIGNYTAHGISAISVQGSKRVEILHIPDVYLNCNKLVQLCNQYQLDPIHLMDVIEDFME